MKAKLLAPSTSTSTNRTTSHTLKPRPIRNAERHVSLKGGDEQARSDDGPCEEVQPAQAAPRDVEYSFQVHGLPDDPRAGHVPIHLGV
ncbi:hypothetical protein GCM10009692_06750 [Leucobacter aridicollis]